MQQVGELLHYRDRLPGREGHPVHGRRRVVAGLAQSGRRRGASGGRRRHSSGSRCNSAEKIVNLLKKKHTKHMYLYTTIRNQAHSV